MYRFGLIGYGAMGNYHAQQIGTMPDFAVSAVYDIAPEKEKARAEGRDVCDSLEELLMRKDVDAVILAVPNNFHKPLAVAAMHAGKHVLCEKPVMMNSRDLLEVLAVSEQTGMLFTVHQNRRWDRIFASSVSASKAAHWAARFTLKAVCRARRASRGTGAAHRRREAACCWIGASIC